MFGGGGVNSLFWVCLKECVCVRVTDSVLDVASHNFQHLLFAARSRLLGASLRGDVEFIVIAARKAAKVNMVVKGSQEIYWQKKSLTNLQRLWPKVKIDIQ